jgi:pimeloyl-ACP methyl ester carboxylesterase
MPSAVVNGVELYWQSSGEEGDHVVLVHGSWGDHHSWDRIVPALARSFRVLAYDRRGHSRSGRSAAQGRVWEDVADLGALIEHLDLAPAHILGSSFGGSIVLRLASARPDLFRSLLVHEPPLFGLLENPAARAMLQTAQERVRAVLELLENELMEAGARRFTETIAFGPGAWAQLPDELRQTFIFNAPTFLDEQRDPEWLTLDLPGLARFSRPALLTQGDQSQPFFPLIVDKLAGVLPRAQRRTLPGAGHVPQLTHPEAYVETVGAFIRHSPSGRT